MQQRLSYRMCCRRAALPPAAASLASGCPRAVRAAIKAAASGSANAPTAPEIDERQMLVKLSIAASTGRLDLSDLRLNSLPAGLWEISDLEDLSLAGNDLRQIVADLGSLKALKRLVVAGNRLRGLPPTVGQLHALDGLWAHGNAIEQLPEEVGQLQGLRTLSLAGEGSFGRVETLCRVLCRDHGAGGTVCLLCSLVLIGMRPWSM